MRAKASCIEKRVAAGGNHDAFAAEVGFQGADDLLQIRADAQDFGTRGAEECEGRIRADQEFCAGEQLTGAGGHAGAAVTADADDVNLRFGRGQREPRLVGRQA
jgi:hypothetical protein